MFELTNLTTLKLPFRAASILKLSSIENVCVSMPELASAPRLILGGGSNLVVLEPEFEGVVLRPEIRCFEMNENGSNVFLEVGAGHQWHQVVMRTLEHGWYGLERNITLGLSGF